MQLLSISTVLGAGSGALHAQPAPDSIALGIQHFAERRFDEAKLLLAPFADRAGTRAGDVHLYLGRIALRAGDPPAAIRHLERAVAANERRADAHLWLARALVRQAVTGSKLKLPFHARRARAEMLRAIALDPDALEARFDLGQYYLLAPGILGGSAERAREQAEEIARRSPYHGHLARAAVAEAAKDTAGAEREYRAAIALAPDSAAAHLALGRHYTLRRRWDDAMAAARRVVALGADEPFVWYGIGLVAAESGRFAEEGERALRTYLASRPKEGDPSFASAHYRLGILYHKAGRLPDARRELEAALALDPGSERARKALSGLR